MYDDRREVWVVDDSVAVVAAISGILESGGYSTRAFTDPADMLREICGGGPHVVLTDVVMPGIDGIEVLRSVRAHDPDLPVLLMTASPGLESAIAGIKGGVFDYILKPVRPEGLLMAIGRAASYMDMALRARQHHEELERSVRERTRQLEGALSELKQASLETIHVLTRATEFRDSETAEHIRRIGLYSCRLSAAMGLGSAFCERILHASPMHDVGKIGIPDSLLLKEDRLTSEEFELMKRHTQIGSRMLSGSANETLLMASEIALSHHERWDGTGYPNGISGEGIPLAARIVMLADQYDALRSHRPYKSGFSHGRVMRILLRGDERTQPTHFDPAVLEALHKVEPDFREIFEGGEAGTCETAIAGPMH